MASAAAYNHARDSPAFLAVRGEPPLPYQPPPIAAVISTRTRKAHNDAQFRKRGSEFEILLSMCFRNTMTWLIFGAYVVQMEFLCKMMQ